MTQLKIRNQKLEIRMKLLCLNLFDETNQLC